MCAFSVLFSISLHFTLDTSTGRDRKLEDMSLTSTTPFVSGMKLYSTPWTVSLQQQYTQEAEGFRVQLLGSGISGGSNNTKELKNYILISHVLCINIPPEYVKWQTSHLSCLKLVCGYFQIQPSFKIEPLLSVCYLKHLVSSSYLENPDVFAGVSAKKDKLQTVNERLADCEKCSSIQTGLSGN